MSHSTEEIARLLNQHVSEVDWELARLRSERDRLLRALLVLLEGDPRADEEGEEIEAFVAWTRGNWGPVSE